MIHCFQVDCESLLKDSMFEVLMRMNDDEEFAGSKMDLIECVPECYFVYSKVNWMVVI